MEIRAISTARENQALSSWSADSNVTISRLRSIAGGTEERLARIQQTAVRGPEPALGNSSGSAPCILEALELERRRSTESGPVLEPHPRRGDDAHVPSEPIRRRAGSGPAPDPGSRRFSYGLGGVIARYALHEFINMCEERRVVAALSGGDPPRASTFQRTAGSVEA